MVEISNIIIHILLFVSLYFEIFLLVTFLEHAPKLSERTPKKVPLAHYPSVTIIVPCYNEAKTVEKTFRSIMNLSYPKDKLSIFIVNDGSTDDTSSVLESLNVGSNVRIFNKENGGKHTALNYALDYVESDLVGCLDADSFVDSEALTEIVRYFDNEKVMAVTPAIKVDTPTNTLQLIQRAEYHLGVLIRRLFSFMDSLLVTPGPFSFFRVEVFKTLGKYKEAHNTEDFEIALRMQKNHYKIENAHTAYVYTTTPKTLRALYKQRVRWTYGYLKNAYDYRSLFFKKQYGNLGLFILPSSALFLFSAIYFTAIFLWGVGASIASKFITLQALGLNMFTLPTFDVFFINTQSAPFLVAILFILTMVLITLGKKISAEEKIYTVDILYYLFLYGFIAPFWLVGATVNAVRSKKGSWIDEKSV